MPTPRSALRRLAGIHASYGPAPAAEKETLLDALAGGALPTAREVRQLHDLLCFLRAFPDSREVLARVEVMLAGFERRRDLRRHRGALGGSGIAGTTLEFNFFAATARRLARRWPDALTLVGSSVDAARLGRVARVLALPAERAAFDDPAFAPRSWVRRMSGSGTDAALLLGAWDALPIDRLVADACYDELDPLLRLAPGPDTPARTREKHPGLPLVCQTAPLSRERPDLQRELRKPPRSVRPASPSEARALVELAQNCMLPRERDLEAFAYASSADVRLVDAGDGIVFACIGVLPERRSLLEAVYGFLMLKNGVAIGYALCSALFGSSEVAFNVFETFRGGESARLFGRLVATIHHLFGSTTFAIDPYQLGGLGNKEGLASGAFWFYQKLGFRPRDAAVVRVMERELAAMARRRHRSSVATLKTLSSKYVLWHAGRPRSAVLGILELAQVALHVSAYLADRFGADRDRARRVCAREMAAALGAGKVLRSWNTDEREAWLSWAPLLASLPELASFGRAERRALVGVVKAKGGACEGDFVARFDAHRRLRNAIAAVAAPASSE
jgi:hypothetical protein